MAWQRTDGRPRTHARRAQLVAVLAIIGCGDTSANDGAEQSDDGSTGPVVPGSDSGTDVDAMPDTDSGDSDSDSGPPPSPPTACTEPTDVTANPTTIGEAVDFINALPHPVTLDCFVERLERPLSVTATFSTVSLQPAVGAESPRVFLFADDFIMSVATDGELGSRLLEFGEFVTPTKSIKGELEFPVTEMLDASAPLDGVFDGTGSKCRICHGGESEAPQYEQAFQSDALRFRDEELVPLSTLQEQYEACQSMSASGRCTRLGALMGFGQVDEGEFPQDLPTIYDYGD